MGLDLKGIKINDFNTHELRISSNQLKGIIDNISIEIKFGNNKNYQNFVEVITKKNKKTRFLAFVYGREAFKFIEHFKNNDIKFGQFDDCNAF